jgi:hypothetical protein
VGFLLGDGLEVPSLSLPLVPTMSVMTHLPTQSSQPRTQTCDSATSSFISDWVTKIEIARRLKVGQRKAAELVTLPWWPAPRELSPRVLRWSWREIEHALNERAPRRTERNEPEALRAARAKRQAV